MIRGPLHAFQICLWQTRSYNNFFMSKAFSFHIHFALPSHYVKWVRSFFASLFKMSATEWSHNLTKWWHAEIQPCLFTRQGGIIYFFQRQIKKCTLRTSPQGQHIQEPGTQSKSSAPTTRCLQEHVQRWWTLPPPMHLYQCQVVLE